jgi:hypothetical protein
MCFGRTNPEFQTGVDEPPRTVHHHADKPSNGTPTSKPSGGFLSNTPYGRSKAIQHQIKTGEVEGVKKPT